MTAITVTLLLLAVVSTACIWQERRHRRHLATIPIRVHINGTRGKSSVTRLIAAGLRAGGIRTIAKTTGTTPRFIYADGTEVPVARAGKANAIEQVRIVRRASQLGAQALVTECMGVKPEIQSLLEDRMIQSTHSVITNARADHLDEMGPTVRDVARNLGRTVSHRGQFFTSERDHLDILCEIARQRQTSVNVALASTVDPSMMAGFTYLEHEENVALALAVCSSLGVAPETALAGMHACTPDLGALRIYRLDVFGKQIRFINAFAMNDPDSYRLVWGRLSANFPPGARALIIANCRADRVQRAEQMGELIALHLHANHYLVTGEGTAAVYHKARSLGVPRASIDDLGGQDASHIFNRVLACADAAPLYVFGIGNIVGLGDEIVQYFSSRGDEIVYRSTT